MAGPRHPESRWFVPAVALAAILCAASGWWCDHAAMRSRSFALMSEGARAELGKLDVPAHATAGEESRWVADGFETGTLIAPVGPLPCREAANGLSSKDHAAVLDAFNAVGANDDDARISALAPIADANPSNLLVSDMLATCLVSAGRYAEADHVITQALDSTDLDERIIAAARTPNSTLQLEDAQFATVIHLYHALGIARLSENGTQAPWIALKNVIGSVKELSAKRLLGTVRHSPTADKLLIPAPGCAPSAASLSSYDLYNNLIIGYLRRPDYADTDQARLREFQRDPKTFPGAVYRLLIAQRDRARTDGWKNEAQLWALSNAEQVLDWRRPDDARLDFNIVQLLDWWTSAEHCGPVCTPSLLADLRVAEDDLIAVALRRRNVTTGQQREFAVGMTRMVARSHLDRMKLASDFDVLRNWLPLDKAATVDDLLNAARVRAVLPQWIVDPAPEAEPPFDKLGRRARSWRAAALSDFTAAAAIWSSGRPAPEKRQVLVASRQLLGAAAVPPEVQQLEKDLSPRERLEIDLSGSGTWWAFVSTAGGLLLWLLIVWILLQIREWRALRKSFYNVELDYQRETGGRHR
jgi:hypothetical protein